MRSGAKKPVGHSSANTGAFPLARDGKRGADFSHLVANATIGRVRRPFENPWDRDRSPCNDATF